MIYGGVVLKKRTIIILIIAMIILLLGLYLYLEKEQYKKDILEFNKIYSYENLFKNNSNKSEELNIEQEELNIFLSEVFRGDR